jgi:hypothetical protein
MYAISAISNMLHNQAVITAGKGNPEAPPPPPPVDPNTLPPGMREAALQAQQQEQVKAAQAAEAERIKQGGQPEMNPAQMLVRMIERPLIQHINRGDSGHAFAAWFIDGQGMEVYGQVKSYGKDSLIQAIAAYSPAVIQTLRALGDEATNRFMDEFMAGPEDPAEEA